MREGLSAQAMLLADKVMLMRIKSKAKGSAGIPTASRLFLGVVYVPLEPTEKFKCVSVFVSAKWTIGKVIDELATICRVHNENSVAGAPQLRLYLHRDCKMLDTSVLAGETDELNSGAVVVLSKRDPLDPTKSYPFVL